MYKKIRIVQGECPEAFFSIDNYAFEKVDENCKNTKIYKYQFQIGMSIKSEIDIRLWIDEVIPQVEFLTTAPEELRKYIQLYEENANPNEECLFHDFRTKYIDFARIKYKVNKEMKEDIFLYGYSADEEYVYIVVKTFSLITLDKIYNYIIKKCLEQEMDFVLEEDIRWIRLNSYKVRDNIQVPVAQEVVFLNATLVKTNFEMFYKVFRQIDAEGFLSRKLYKEYMYRNEKQVKQVSKFFSPYWKFSSGLSEKTRDILYLHDEVPEDEYIDSYVYAFKPSLMKYYLQNWFEDFTLRIVEGMEWGCYNVKHSMKGCRFNFFNDNDDNNVREIDLIIEIQRSRDSKIIAIECKKTLSRKEIQMTNKKCKEKVLESGNNVFDAFIHIGCFKGDVEFNIPFNGTKEKYKQGIINAKSDDYDVPFYAFTIKSIDDYQKKILCIVDEIFKNW